MARLPNKSQLGECLERISDYFVQMNDDFAGATASAAGAKGMVPAPAAGDNSKFLRGDGSWATPAGGGGSAFVVSMTQPTESGIMWIKPTN